MPSYFGKYRGKVIANVDDENRGRLLVNVPFVMGVAGQNWALPSVPVAGPLAGVYVLPPPQSNVWVEFEEGDGDKPIWTGGFWDRGTAPVQALTPPAPVPHILLQTTAQNAVHLSDGPAPPLTTSGVVIRSGASMIVVSPEGVKIIAPLIELTGLTKVNIDALVITP